MHLGEHVTLIFEDELTIRYQVQEMLRVERIFEEAGIQDELDAYNPLIPDGRNFKATMMIEYEDVNERRAALAQLKGIEERAWVRVEGMRAVYADRRRGPRARERGEDLVGALPALRAHGRMVARAASAACGSAMGIDHPTTRARSIPFPPRSARRSSPDLAPLKGPVRRRRHLQAR